MRSHLFVEALVAEHTTADPSDPYSRLPVAGRLLLAAISTPNQISTPTPTIGSWTLLDARGIGDKAGDDDGSQLWASVADGTETGIGLPLGQYSYAVVEVDGIPNLAGTGGVIDSALGITDSPLGTTPLTMATMTAAGVVNARLDFVYGEHAPANVATTTQPDTTLVVFTGSGAAKCAITVQVGDLLPSVEPGGSVPGWTYTEEARVLYGGYSVLFRFAGGWEINRIPIG